MSSLASSRPRLPSRQGRRVAFLLMASFFMILAKRAAAFATASRRTCNADGVSATTALMATRGVSQFSATVPRQSTVRWRSNRSLSPAGASVITQLSMLSLDRHDVDGMTNCDERYGCSRLGPFRQNRSRGYLASISSPRSATRLDMGRRRKTDIAASDSTDASSETASATATATIAKDEDTKTKAAAKKKAVAKKKAPPKKKSPSKTKTAATKLKPKAAKPVVDTQINLNGANATEALPLKPEDLGPLKMPVALSPSSVLEFQKCPQSFMFQYLYKMRQPNNLALAKGKLCHSALEQVFDLEKPERTLENLQNLFRTNWGNVRDDDDCRFLFNTLKEGGGESDEGKGESEGEDEELVHDIQAEREWGLSALKLLQNYVEYEDPSTISRPNPMKRESWVVSKLTVDPSLGITSPTYNDTADETDEDDAEDDDDPDATAKKPSKTTKTKPKKKKGKAEDDGVERFLVRGIVDRMDLVKDGPGAGVSLRIVDYKTGKAPHLKYTPAMNHKIMNEAFFQLKIYALLLQENKKKYKKSTRKSLDHRFLRLLYLTSHNDKAESLDYDLGATKEERDAELQAVHAELANVWKSIQELVDGQDPKAFVGCARPFCYCHKCRPRFAPGSVWEPPPDGN